MRPYDVCILTAVNEIQAEGYRKQITWRRQKQLLPQETDFRVIADPGGKHVGSGSSTLYVLSKLAEEEKGDVDTAFLKKRILILHSGGESRRLPAYSAIGKVFAPLPSPKSIAVFDAIFDIYQQFPVVEEGQVVVGSGDVILNFDPTFIAFEPKGVTGVAYPDNPETASRHGVYVCSKSVHDRNPSRVKDFLQKPNMEELVAADALDAAERALVDTGVMNLSLDAIRCFISMTETIKKIKTGGLHLDLYKDITFALLGKKKRDDLPGLTGLDFHVHVLPYCGFFHIGRSRELLQNLYTLTHAGALYQFTNLTRTNIESGSVLGRAYCFNAAFRPASTRIEPPALIEGCGISRPLELDGNNILTGIPDESGALHLKNGICLSVFPLKGSRWAAVLYGIEDSFKPNADTLFLNEPFHSWRKSRSVNPSDLWPPEDVQDIWTARLFPVHRDPAIAIRTALDLQKADGALVKWKAAKRISMKEILAMTDHDVVLNQFSEIEKKSNLFHVKSRLEADDALSASDVLEWCSNGEDRTELHQNLKTCLEKTTDVLFKARLQKILSLVLSKINASQGRVAEKSGIGEPEKAETEAFSLVRQAVEKGLGVFGHVEHGGLQIRTDEVVWVSLPARLDFSGGWTDTPPYCLEHGGSVLNAAVKLNGQYPIQVIGKRLAEPRIRINSIDLGKSENISDWDSLLAYDDPGDWMSLPKAGFAAAGILNRNRKQTLSALLKKYGGGIDLTLFSALPAGSGLGTSSILGLAIVTCLARMFGVPLTKNELFSRTLYMEQLMTTGGGWQDQIGGGVGGLKLIQTAGGLEQIPVISWAHWHRSGSGREDRFLLYYTGYRRMAKNILTQIVGRYLERDPATLDCLTRLRKLSERMKDHLDRSDIDGFGSGIAETWKLNKRLDKGSTNEAIETLLKKIEGQIVGAKLLGAGGGGFLFIVSKGDDHSRRIREILEQHPPNDRARFFDFDVDPDGMQVKVL